jgi:hypothetical protein
LAIVVERAVMRLPVEQRAAVVAADMHRYSVAETANVLVGRGHREEPLFAGQGEAGRGSRVLRHGWCRVGRAEPRPLIRRPTFRGEDWLTS